MNLQLFRLTDANLAQKLTDIGALVALQLNYFAVLRMLDDRAIAGELLLERAQQALLVELFADALQRHARSRRHRTAGVALT